MAEYIEREAVIKVLHENTTEMESDIYYGSNKGVPKDEIEDIINEIPAADVVEVRHGEWGDDGIAYVCNICGKNLVIEQGTAEMNYCPNCGAKMDEKDG